MFEKIWMGLSLVGVLWPAAPVLAEKPVASIIVSAPRSDLDFRDSYNLEVLRLALEATEARYGGFSIGFSRVPIPDRRLAEMVDAQEPINLMFSPTTPELEERLLPVYFPIDRGLLGYRLLLIRATDQSRFASVRTLSDLRKFTVGQGLGWGDVPIFRNAGIPVETSSEYEALFAMLLGGRFDFFSRSIGEAVQEYAERKERNPDLALEESLLLVYPYPNYIFVSRKNPWLAERLTLGFETLLRNGTLDRVFQKYNGAALQAARVKDRRILRLENPNLPKNGPTADLIAKKEYWFNPLR